MFCEIRSMKMFHMFLNGFSDQLMKAQNSCYSMRARSTRQCFSCDNSIKSLCTIKSVSILFTLQCNAIFTMPKIKIKTFIYDAKHNVDKNKTPNTNELCSS